MTKNVQKWPENRVFWLFKKILLLDLSGICVKWKFLWFINTAKTACLGKTWFSSYSQKWLPANEISIFFNRQYFTNRLISHFWHVDRHEWKEQGSLRSFLKKFSFGQMSHFMLKNSKIAQPYNSYSLNGLLLKPWNSIYWFSFHLSPSFYLFMQHNKRISVMESFTIKQPSKFSLPLSNCSGFCWEKAVFLLMCVGKGKSLPRWNCFHNIHVNFWINYYKK